MTNWLGLYSVFVPMRTVLAVDELLAMAVRSKMRRPAEIYGRERMRDEGDRIVRKAVDEGPCVLAIGGLHWNPLSWLEEWRLPSSVAVVLLLPRISDPIARRAASLRVFSVVPTRMSGIVSCVADECLLAADSLRGFPALRPVLVVSPQHQPEQSGGRVLVFPVRSLEEQAPSQHRRIAPRVDRTRATSTCQASPRSWRSSTS